MRLDRRDSTCGMACRLRLALVVLVALASAVAAAAAVDDPFPDPGPATRADAVVRVAGHDAAAHGCVTPQIQELERSPGGARPSGLRAMLMLKRRAGAAGSQVVHAADGVPVFYETNPSAFDRIASADLDRDGMPDRIEQVLWGLERARGLLIDQLRLPAPAGLEVVLLELGSELDGYVVPGADGRPTIVLDATGADGSRSVMHQYAHAVALAAAARFPSNWGEALATWTVITLEGGPDAAATAQLSRRIERLNDGLTSPAPELAAGNALWLAFLDEAYGPAAVAVTIGELAAGGSVAEALDRALARVSDDDLRAAFREFHLWTILVGPRSDRWHFSFAGDLDATSFASSADGLPALSVHSDPSVAAWGATQVLIRPGTQNGGLHIRFEGEFASRWEADLLLVGTNGELRRLPVELSSDGHGETTLPLDGLAEALLLVRNLGDEAAAPRRYTYAAHHARGYPFELVRLEAAPLGRADEGIDIAWQTASEQQLIGFNILRVRETGGPEVVVNPVWIPALGNRSNSTSYHYLDRTADPDAVYLYRLQGITTHGLTRLSDPVLARRSTGGR